MANDTTSLFNQIPASEKISIVAKALTIPGCPIPPEVISSLTRELKLDLFDKLVESGAIKYIPHQQRTQAEHVNLAFEENRTGPSVNTHPGAHNDYATLYSIIGTDLNEDIEVAISQKARLQGLYIIGANGTGKTTLLATLILKDIFAGLGVALIEPHGDLTKTIIAGLPENRIKDVILLDMTDSEYPFGLNLFQCNEPRTIREIAATANVVYHVFKKVWALGPDSSPRLLQVLRAVTRTLIENPGTALSEVSLLLSSDTVRARMVENLTNQEIISFWEG